MDDIDQEKIMKEIEKQASKMKDKDKGEEPNTLTEEELKILQEASHDKSMFMDKDGNINHVEEIEFIVQDVLKHQLKAFKIKRDLEEIKETVEEVEGYMNHLEERDYAPHDSAALKYLNQELISDQRNVIFFLIRRIGINLLTGKSIMNVSMPIKIFEASSFLEKIARDFRYAPHYFKQAMETVGIIERVKLITIWHMVTLHLEPQMHKPFNPILGETFQGVIGEYEIAIEQI